MRETFSEVVTDFMLAEPHSAGTFFVVLREPIDASWAEYLGNVQLVAGDAGDAVQSTVLTGLVMDFAAFVGLIGKLQNLGLTVQSISYQQL